MSIYTTPRGGGKAAHSNLPFTGSLSPLQTYAIRALMRRARIGLSHALLIAELAGICREANHD